MFKRMRNNKGFTLIEIMVAVAIVGILAAIAITAYLDHTVKARLAEVSSAMDALAQAAMEYHATKASFPDDTGAYANVNAFVFVSRDYVDNWTYNLGASNNEASFIAQLNLMRVNGDTMIMTISYVPDVGYIKTWDPAMTLPMKYRPKK
jgi:prepilin-type N-terminal cleavage/methylation domain-containing protein